MQHKMALTSIKTLYKTKDYYYYVKEIESSHRGPTNKISVRQGVPFWKMPIFSRQRVLLEIVYNYVFED